MRAQLVMVARRDVVAIPQDATVGQVDAILRHHPFSHYPVFLSSLDDIVGVISAERARALIAADAASFSLDGHLRPPIFVPAAEQIDRALAEMRAQGSAFAIVVDEFGQTVGVATHAGATGWSQGAGIENDEAQLAAADAWMQSIS